MNLPLRLRIRLTTAGRRTLHRARTVVVRPQHGAPQTLRVRA